MVQFATPWILWGATAALIPILIHLFGKRKTRAVEFSSLRFLQNMQREQVRRVRLKQLILLLLRTLFILLLVFVFAGPRYAPSSAENFANESAVVIFDNTISATARHNGSTILESLSEMTEAMFPEALEYETVVWTSLMEPSNRVITLENNRPEDFLEGLTVREGMFHFPNYVQDLREWLDSQGLNAVDVYLLTDGQRAQYLQTGSVNLSDWGSSRWIIVTPQQEFAQSGIQSVQFNTDVLQPGTSIPIDVSLFRSDSTAPISTGIQVLQDGKKIGQSLVTWEDELLAEESFDIPIQNPGYFQLGINLEEDEYRADNFWYLNGYVPDNLKVILVSDSPEDRLFLETALQSITAVQQNIDLVQESPDMVMEQLTSDVDVIILSDVILSGAVTTAIGQMVEEGTGLMVFPGESFRGRQEYSIGNQLPMYHNYRQLEQGTFSVVDAVEWTHPVLSNMSSVDRATIRLPQVSRYFQLDPDISHTIMQMNNGSPLLVETSWGIGKVWLWTTALSLEWTDLPRRGIFLPTLMRSLYYLAGLSQKYMHQLMAGEPIVYPLPQQIMAEQLTLITPEGESVALPISGEEVRYTNTSRSGQYSLYNDQELVGLFSVNTSLDERDMNRMNAAEWNVLLGDGFYDLVEPSDAQMNLTEAALVHGRPLWQWFMMLALACVIGEMLLTKTAYRKSDEE